MHLVGISRPKIGKVCVGALANSPLCIASIIAREYLIEIRSPHQQNKQVKIQIQTRAFVLIRKLIGLRISIFVQKISFQEQTGFRSSKSSHDNFATIKICFFFEIYSL